MSKWKWDIAPEMRRSYMSLPEVAQMALVSFLDGVVSDDPTRLLEEARAENEHGVYREVQFGGRGVVALVIHVIDKLVYVVRIAWAGE